MDNPGYDAGENGSVALQSIKPIQENNVGDDMSYAKSFHDDVEIKMTSDSYKQSKESSNSSNNDNQITFTWDNITIVKEDFGASCLKRKKGVTKTILHNVSGYVRPGQLLAIMGASGAGKSTLLNALTFRNLSGLTVVSGARYANGNQITPNSLTSVSAYIQQDDLFIGSLTVKEHLTFQALVRMDKEIPYKERMKRVEIVAKELGLTKCLNTLAGSSNSMNTIKGISGGEMKRLSFAAEILTDPPLMFCDEPTSGLDSFMAQNVVENLRDMAAKGKTIIATIHQPSSQVFALFDRVLLMAEGRVAYLGKTKEAQNFFSGLNFPCPLHYNPADHYVHVLAIAPGNEELCRNRVRQICDEFDKSSSGGQKIKQAIKVQRQNSSLSSSLENASKKSKSPYKASWWKQFTALLWRGFLSTLKDPQLLQIKLVQAAMIAVILGIIYLNQDYTTKEGIRNITGALFLMLTNQTFSNMFPVVQVFTLELGIFMREHFNGMYRTDTYYITRQMAEMPVQILSPVIFTCIFYWMVGMNPDPVRFLIACLINILLVQVVVGFGYMTSCLAPSLPIALAISAPLLIPLMIFGGFFLDSSSVPSWLVWFKYIGWFLYANELLTINQWEGVEVNTCPDPTKPIPPCYTSGDQIIEAQGFDKDNYAFDFGMLAVLAVAYRLIGFVVLLFKTYRRTSQKTKVN